MSFRASEFEFRHRFWVIGAIFWFGFALYRIDHTSVASTLAAAVGGGDASARAVFAIGTALCASGALVRSWAESYLHSSVVHDAELHADAVVADGPYRHVRNPLYLGLVLIALGMGLMASRVGYAAIVGGMTAFALRLILREEAALLASQGESYRRFYDAVPRLVPALRPRLPKGGRPPNWRDGFLGETMTWGFTVAMAAFTLTLRTAWFAGALAASFAIYFVQAALRRRGPSPP
jgi:protein-S-isoprenylcysteine O-methyltransferase Ste14